jgi:hypothetical protein
VCILLLILDDWFNEFCLGYPLNSVLSALGNDVHDVPTIPDHHLLGEFVYVPAYQATECISQCSGVLANTPLSEPFAQYSGVFGPQLGYFQRHHQMGITYDESYWNAVCAHSFLSHLPTSSQPFAISRRLEKNSGGCMEDYIENTYKVRVHRTSLQITQHVSIRSANIYTRCYCIHTAN